LCPGLLLLWVVNAITGVYLYSLFSYVEGCVSPGHNGTLLCDNLYSLAYDHAAAEGDGKVLKGTDTQHERRNVYIYIYIDIDK